MENLKILTERYGDIISNLKEETSCLTKKIKEAREAENWGTYKNLIQAYKEIVDLYMSILRDNKMVPQEMNVNLKNIEDLAEPLKSIVLSIPNKSFVNKPINVPVDTNIKDIFCALSKEFDLKIPYSIYTSSENSLEELFEEIIKILK